MTCQCLHSSNIISVKKKSPNNNTKSTSNVPVWSRGHQEVAVPTHALLLSVLGAMEGTSASWASDLGSRDGWSKHFKSGFCKTVLRLNRFLKSLISSLLWPLVPSYCSALPLGSQGLPSYPLHQHPDSPVLSPLVPMGWGKASSTSACCQPLHMVPGL